MNPFNWRKILENTGFLGVSGGLIVLGFIQGIQTYTFQLDLLFVALEVLLIEAAASSVFFTGFIAVSAVLFFWKLKTSRNPKSGQKNSKISCIVPTYRDSQVLDNSVGSLTESDYENMEVVIVCEEDDEESIRKAEELASNSKVSYLVNTRYPGTKAGAINFAAEETSSEVIAVFDADQKVNPEFLSSAVSLLDGYDVVQGRYIPRPTGFIESMAYYESLIFSYLTRQVLNLLTDFKLIGSRDTVIKRSVFEELDGYPEDVLTEDYDFAHEFYRKGFEAEELLLKPTTEEAAHSLKDWWGQRKRWMTGYFQVLVKSAVKSARNFQGYRDILSVFICAGSIIGSFLMLTLVSKFIILFLLGADSIYLIPIGTVAFVGLIGRFTDYRSKNVGNIGFSWILTPLIFPFFSLITIKAFFEFLLDKNDKWYRVEK